MANTLSLQLPADALADGSLGIGVHIREPPRYTRAGGGGLPSVGGGGGGGGGVGGERFDADVDEIDELLRALRSSLQVCDRKCHSAAVWPSGCGEDAAAAAHMHARGCEGVAGSAAYAWDGPGTWRSARTDADAAGTAGRANARGQQRGGACDPLAQPTTGAGAANSLFMPSSLVYARERQGPPTDAFDEPWLFPHEWWANAVRRLFDWMEAVFRAGLAATASRILSAAGIAFFRWDGRAGSAGAEGTVASVASAACALAEMLQQPWATTAPGSACAGQPWQAADTATARAPGGADAKRRTAAEETVALTDAALRMIADMESRAMQDAAADPALSEVLTCAAQAMRSLLQTSERGARDLREYGRATRDHAVMATRAVSIVTGWIAGRTALRLERAAAFYAGQRRALDDALTAPESECAQQQARLRSLWLELKRAYDAYVLATAPAAAREHAATCGHAGGHAAGGGSGGDQALVLAMDVLFASLGSEPDFSEEHVRLLAEYMRHLDASDAWTQRDQRDAPFAPSAPPSVLAAAQPRVDACAPASATPPAPAPAPGAPPHATTAAAAAAGAEVVLAALRRRYAEHVQALDAVNARLRACDTRDAAEAQRLHRDKARIWQCIQSAIAVLRAVAPSHGDTRPPADPAPACADRMAARASHAAHAAPPWPTALLASGASCATPAQAAALVPASSGRAFAPYAPYAPSALASVCGAPRQHAAKYALRRSVSALSAAVARAQRAWREVAMRRTLADTFLEQQTAACLREIRRDTELWYDRDVNRVCTAWNDMQYGTERRHDDDVKAAAAEARLVLDLLADMERKMVHFSDSGAQHVRAMRDFKDLAELVRRSRENLARIEEFHDAYEDLVFLWRCAYAAAAATTTTTLATLADGDPRHAAAAAVC